MAKMPGKTINARSACVNMNFKRLPHNAANPFQTETVEPSAFHEYKGLDEAMAKYFGFTIVFLITLSLLGCSDNTRSLSVTATAYTSSVKETSSTPSVGAWGDTLKPGMKAIAVSRDLIDLGLTQGVEVSIQGLPGRYKVLDKTHKRWRRRIDIYMGDDVQKAKAWGKRKVTIRWEPEE